MADDIQKSWQQRRPEYCVLPHPDRLAAGATITETRPRSRSSWLFDIAPDFAVGVILGMALALGALWLIAEIG